VAKKQIVPPMPAAPMPQVAHAEAPAPHHAEPHPIVTSPAAEHLNDRMHLAAKPNAGEPLAHRNRSKAGRKG